MRIAHLPLVPDDYLDRVPNGSSERVRRPTMCGTVSNSTGLSRLV